jgi:putative hemolysin
MFGVILVLLFLIVLCGIYVAAEFAALSARRERVKRLADSGNRLAQKLLEETGDAEKLDRYIGGTQIGITITSLVLGAYGQSQLAGIFSPLFVDLGDMQEAAAQSTSAVLVLLLLTGLQMVLSELVPKSVALQYPTQVAILTVLPMRWSLALYSWFIKVLNGSSQAILRLLRQPVTASSHIHSPDEIELMIADSKDGGLLEPDEHLRLQRALRLATRSVRQIMTPRRQIEFVDIASPPAMIVRRISDSPYSRLPVFRGARENIIGVLHTKDVVRKVVVDEHLASIEPLIRPVLFVPRNATADRALGEMRRQKRHQAIVVDEYGGVEGLVTLEDILSEFLGEVADELKKKAPAPEKLPDGRVRLPGGLRVDDVEPWIGRRWESDMDTVGGFVLETLDRLPEPGEKVEIEGTEVEIAEVERNAIRWIVVQPYVPPAAPSAPVPTAPPEGPT